MRFIDKIGEISRGNSRFNRHTQATFKTLRCSQSARAQVERPPQVGHRTKRTPPVVKEDDAIHALDNTRTVASATDCPES